MSINLCIKSYVTHLRILLYFWQNYCILNSSAFLYLRPLFPKNLLPHFFLLFTRFTKNTLTKNTTFSCTQLHSSFQAKKGSNLVLETQRVHCFTKKTGHFLKYFFVQWSAGLHFFIFCILQKTWLQFSAETFRLIKYKAWRKYYKVRSNPC